MVAKDFSMLHIKTMCDILKSMLLYVIDIVIDINRRHIRPLQARRCGQWSVITVVNDIKLTSTIYNSGYIAIIYIYIYIYIYI